MQDGKVSRIADITNRHLTGTHDLVYNPRIPHMV